MQQIKINNNQECTTIDIEGTIGVPEEWQFDDPQQRVATYERFRKSLAAIEELSAAEVVVNIRSTGGDVNDALLIYEALQGLDAQITTRCWGYVASAATVIAQAASEGLREISPNALYLIHNSTCTVDGNANELSQRVELLRKSDERLAELYARRSGREVEHFVELMAQESGEGRWLNSQEAIEAGLADREIEQVPATKRVSEGIESAINSVKGVINRIGAELKGSIMATQEAPKEEQEEAKDGAQGDVQEASKSSQQAKVLSKEASQQTTLPSASQIEFDEVQRQLQPTALERVEDPSLNEARMSANDNAYQHDARRLRGRI